MRDVGAYSPVSWVLSWYGGTTIRTFSDVGLFLFFVPTFPFPSWFFWLLHVLDFFSLSRQFLSRSQRTNQFHCMHCRGSKFLNMPIWWPQTVTHYQVVKKPVIEDRCLLIKFECKRMIRILSVGIKYHMRDLIGDVINNCAWRCDMGRPML